MCNCREMCSCAQFSMYCTLDFLQQLDPTSHYILYITVALHCITIHCNALQYTNSRIEHTTVKYIGPASASLVPNANRSSAEQSCGRASCCGANGPSGCHIQAHAQVRYTTSVCLAGSSKPLLGQAKAWSLEVSTALPKPGLGHDGAEDW